MAKFLPLSFVRVNMSAGSAGSMAFKVLQQGII
jgi:hypothetical protein